MAENSPISQAIRDAVKKALMDREQAQYPDHFIAVAVAMTLDDDGNIPVVITRAQTIQSTVPPDFGQ